MKKMSLSLQERKVVSKQLASRYRYCNKKEKGEILDEFVELTGYNRAYASQVLANWGKKRLKNKRIPVQESRKPRRKRGKTVTYGANVKKALVRIWTIADGICGKRLAPMIPELIPKLEQFGEIKLDEITRHKLLHISAATIDRLLAPEKKKLKRNGHINTRQGTILKQQHPVRTCTGRDGTLPGFVEVVIVGHNGDISGGEFAYTLECTDVATGWTEWIVLSNKAQKFVKEAVNLISTRLPFPLRGISLNNGSEFIHNNLKEIFEENQISLTLPHPYKKNDNSYDEQRNYPDVRRGEIWYNRPETEKQVKLFNRLHEHLRLYVNFFQPSMLLMEKTRNGNRVKKKYDIAKTPFQRVLDHEDIDTKVKKSIKKQYDQLNPAYLKRKINELQTLLEKSRQNQRSVISAGEYNNTGYQKLEQRKIL